MPSSKTPILIVNADDFGWRAEATDRTVECFEAGRITGATALVFMEDSPRAAELGREHEVPIGLHLNLTDPYTHPKTPPRQRERHLAACRHFAGDKLRLRSWTFDPRIQAQVEDTIRDQLERFHFLYDAPPSHVDGHNHVHVCPNVALAGALSGFKRRNALWGWPSSHTAMGLARAARRLGTARRSLTTRYFFDIAELCRRLPPEALARTLSLSRTSSVEVMAHPGFAHEREALTSRAWEQAIAQQPLGSYRALA
jgi:chitin disaccharide deacetylase